MAFHEQFVIDGVEDLIEDALFDTKQTILDTITTIEGRMERNDPETQDQNLIEAHAKQSQRLLDIQDALARRGLAGYVTLEEETKEVV